MDENRHRVSSGGPYEVLMGYSRAVRVGDHVVVAGTAPHLPDGSVDADAGAQAQRCLEIIEGALIEAGSDIADVIRTRIYLVDVSDMDAVAKAHRHVFGHTRPANTTVVVAALLDERWKVEIEAEAVIDRTRQHAR